MSTRVPIEGGRVVAEFDLAGFSAGVSSDTMDERGFVQLSHLTVSEFIAWAASVPCDRVEDIRREITANCDDVVVELIAEELFRAPQLDCAHVEMILAILGESRSEAAISPLRRFIWWTDLFEKPPLHVLPVEAVDGVVDCQLWLNRGALYRARAVEMLCFVSSSTAHEATLEVIREHSEPAVRHAAIDAYLYNHGDSAAAEEVVRRHVCREDFDWVAIPRRTSDMDAKQFDERLASLHAAVEPPPVPRAYPDRKCD